MALLEHETLDGEEVGRLVDAAMGRKAGGFRKVKRADGTVVEVKPPADKPPADKPRADNGGKRPRKAASQGLAARRRAR